MVVGIANKKEKKMQIKDFLKMKCCPLYVVSGEGDYGTREKYTGEHTEGAINARLKKERCNGDRWAYVTDENSQFRGE